MRSWIAAGAIAGFLGVALGAFGAHTLRNVLDERGQDLWHTAVFYQMVHALALVALGILAWQRPGWSLTPAAVALGIGIVIFAGSLYALALGAPRWFGAITPLGGVAFLFAWAWLAGVALRQRG